MSACRISTDCIPCHGTGIQDGPDMACRCQACRGTGKIDYSPPSLNELSPQGGVKALSWDFSSSDATLSLDGYEPPAGNLIDTPAGAFFEDSGAQDEVAPTLLNLSASPSGEDLISQQSGVGESSLLSRPDAGFLFLLFCQEIRRELNQVYQYGCMAHYKPQLLKVIQRLEEKEATL